MDGIGRFDWVVMWEWSLRLTDKFNCLNKRDGSSYFLRDVSSNVFLTYFE